MNNKIRYIVFVLALMLTGIVVNAQLPTADSIKVYYGNQDPDQAKKLWMEFNSPSSAFHMGSGYSARDYEVYTRMYALAPYITYSLYNGYLFEVTDPAKPKPMFVQYLKEESDPAIRMMYVQDILELAKNQIVNLDSINVLRKKANYKDMSEALACIKYAHYNYEFCGDSTYWPAKLYNKERAYALYRKAFQMMIDQKKDISDEIEGYYLNEYFNTCYDLYKSDNEKYYTQFLDDYLEIIKTCDNLLIPYYGIPDSIRLGDRKYVGFYGYKNGFADEPGSGIVNKFKASGAGSTTHLDEYFGSHLNDHRKDQEYLNNAIHFMLTMDSVASIPSFFEYCIASHDLKPTYENCIGCAMDAANMNMRQDMINYYLEAKKCADTDLQRGQVSYLIGTATSYRNPKKGTPEYDAWEKDVAISNSNLQDVMKYSKALQESPSLAVRDYPANASYIMGMNSYRLGGALQEAAPCNKAIEQFNQAKALGYDPVKSNDQIANVRSFVAKLNAAHAKRTVKTDAQKKYEEWKRKQEAEDAFWHSK